MNKIKVNVEKATITQNYIHKYHFKFLGNNIRFGGTGNFFNSQNIVINENVYIGREFYMEAISDIVIESGTMIGPKVTMIAGSHNYNSSDLKAIPYDKRIVDTPIYIGKNVWIGANVTICPGAVIEEGAVIGMGTTVVGHVSAYSVAVSNKQTIIKYRNQNQYLKLKNENMIYNTQMTNGDFQIISKDLLKFKKE